MLTMREPLSLRTARPMIRLSPSFHEKIEANYDTAGGSIKGEELLHLMEEAPWITILEGSQFQISQSRIDNRKHVTLQTVNQVLNRLLLWNEINFTYQDRVCLERQLRKLGIREVSAFLKQVRESCGECRDIYHLAEKYENLDRIFREAEVSMEILQGRQKQEGSGGRTEVLPNTLYHDIYRRLDTRKIYKEIGSFRRNQTAGNQTAACVDETLRFAEYERAGLLLKLAEAGTAAAGREHGIPERMNPYELAPAAAGPGAEPVEKIKSRVISAVLLNLAEQVYTHRLDEHSDVRREWTDFRFAFRETTVHTLKRFEEYHRENRRFTARELAFREEMHMLHKAESAFLTRFENLWENSKTGGEKPEHFSELLQESMKLILEQRESRQEERTVVLQQPPADVVWNSEGGEPGTSAQDREAAARPPVVVQEEPDQSKTEEGDILDLTYLEQRADSEQQTGNAGKEEPVRQKIGAEKPAYSESRKAVEGSGISSSTSAAEESSGEKSTKPISRNDTEPEREKTEPVHPEPGIEAAESAVARSWNETGIQTRNETEIQTQNKTETQIQNELASWTRNEIEVQIPNEIKTQIPGGMETQTQKERASRTWNETETQDILHQKLTAPEEEPLKLTFLRQQETVKEYVTASEITKDQAVSPSSPDVLRETLTRQLAQVVQQIEKLSGAWESIAISGSWMRMEPGAEREHYREQISRYDPAVQSRFRQTERENDVPQARDVPAAEMNLLQENMEPYSGTADAGAGDADKTRAAGTETAGLFWKQVEKERLERERQREVLTKQQKDDSSSETFRTEQTVNIRNTGEVFHNSHQNTVFIDDHEADGQSAGGIWPETPALWEMNVPPPDMELARNRTESGGVSPEETARAERRFDEIRTYLDKIRKQTVSSRQNVTEQQLLKAAETIKTTVKTTLAGTKTGTAGINRPVPFGTGGSSREIKTYLDKTQEQTVSNQRKSTETQWLKLVDMVEMAAEIKPKHDVAGTVNDTLQQRLPAGGNQKEIRICLDKISEQTEVVHNSGQETPTANGNNREIKQYLDKINEQNVLTYRELSEKQLWKTAEPLKQVPDMTRMRKESRQALTDPAGMLEHFRKLRVVPEEAAEKNTESRQQLEVILKHADDTTRYIYEQIWNYSKGEKAGPGPSHVRPAEPIQLVTELDRLLEERQERMLLTNRESNLAAERSMPSMNIAADFVLNTVRSGDMEKTGNAVPVPAASIVYKQPPAAVAGEIIEQLVKNQEVPTRKEISSSVIESAVKQQKEAVKQTEMMTNRSSRELQDLIEKGISKQMRVISEKVYHRLEKKMENEMARRGR